MGFWLMRTLNHVSNKPTFWTAARTNSSRISLSELLNLRRAQHQLNECLRGISPEYLWNKVWCRPSFCSWLGRCFVKRISLLVKLLGLLKQTVAPRPCRPTQVASEIANVPSGHYSGILPEYFPGPRGLFSGRSVSGVFSRLGHCVVAESGTNSSWTAQAGRLKLNGSSWMAQAGRLKLDSSSWTAQAGRLKPDGSSWTAQAGPLKLDGSSWTVKLDGSSWTAPRCIGLLIKFRGLLSHTLGGCVIKCVGLLVKLRALLEQTVAPRPCRPTQVASEIANAPSGHHSGILPEYFPGSREARCRPIVFPESSPGWAVA